MWTKGETADWAKPKVPARRDQKIKRSREGRWSWTFKLAQKRSWVGRWSWAAKVGLLSLRLVPQQQCNRHCPCDSAQARQLRSALAAGQWRGDTALTLTSIVLAAVHCLSGLFQAVSAIEPSLFVPPPPPPPPPPAPSLISHLASVDVKQNGPLGKTPNPPWPYCCCLFCFFILAGRNRRLQLLPSDQLNL